MADSGIDLFSKKILTKQVVKKIQLKNHGGLRNWDFW